MSAQMVGFCRRLRAEGVNVTPGQVQVFAQAILQLEVLRPGEFYWAARTTLIARPQDYPLFDQVFQQFWPQLGMGRFPGELLEQSPVLPPRQKPTPRPGEVGRPPSVGQARSSDQPLPVTDRSHTYSASEMLRHKRFDLMSQDETLQAQQLMHQFDWPLAERRSRRPVVAASGSRIDFRRSFRKAVRYQGELLWLARQELLTRPRPLVVLADISGSMERYARLLLHFIHAFAQQQTDRGRRRVESFVFGTRLTRITRQLQRRSVDLALAQVGQKASDWSGGTRIGESLQHFNQRWARQVLGRGAVILVISDGWDQGDPQLLSQQMQRLQKRCYRILWLNPLLGSPGYRPLTRGLQAALPYCHHFLPIHNLVSLEQLAQTLGKLDQYPASTRFSGG